MFEANLNPASLASASVGEGQNLLASLYRAGRFLLLLRVTIRRLFMFLQYSFNFFAAFTAGCFNGHGTKFANQNLSAVIVGFWAFMRLA